MWKHTVKCFFLCWIFLIPSSFVYASNSTTDNQNNTKNRTITYKTIEDLEKSGFEESIYTIDVNEEKKDRAEIILLKNNVPYIPEDELKTWRLKELPTCIVIKYADRNYYGLDCFTGVHYKLNQDKMFLDIFLPTPRFEETEIGITKKITPLASPPKIPGGFLNYDLDVEHLAPKNSRTTNRYNGLFEAGFFNRFGVGQATLLYRDSNRDFTNNKITRLSTKWTYDDINNMRRFQFGDTQTNNGILGRSILFGGIHIAKNYSLQPDTQIYPLPDIQPGKAFVPSTVDFYLNNVRLFRKEVPPGPFDINMFPMLTGAGTIKVVTRDLFGKEQIITLPFYYTTELLKKGIHQYRIDAGFTRENFGLNSFDYGDFLASATDRYGLTDTITLNGHIAAHTKNVYMVNGGFDYLPNPKLGIVTIGVGGSMRKNGKKGAFFSAGFNTRRRDWRFGVVTRHTTKNFLDLGYDPESYLPSQQTQVYFSHRIGKKSGISFGLTSQHNRNPSSSSNIVSGSFNTRLFKSWSVTISVQDNLNLKRDRAVRIYISRRIFNNNNLNLSSTISETGNDGRIGISKNLTDAPGWGYNFSGEARRYNGTDSQRGYGRLSYQSNVGTYHAEAAKDNYSTSYRLNALGGVLFFDGKSYLSRLNRTSFGVVEVPGYKDVRVYRNNVLAGRTNADGKVVIPKLLPYYENRLGIDANDIPLDTRIAGGDSQTVVPYYLSGIKTFFQVNKVYSVIFKLIDQSGNVIPIGATVKGEDSDEEFYVDEGGEVYLEMLGKSGKFRAIGTDGECDFSVNIPKDAKPVDLIYELGTVSCTFTPYPEEKIKENKSPSEEESALEPKSTEEKKIEKSILEPQPTTEKNTVGLQKTDQPPKMQR